MIAEKFSDIQNYQLEKGKLDFEDFTIFPNAPKVFLLTNPSQILFVETGKLVSLPQSSPPINWQMISNAYSTIHNLVTIIDNNILTIQFDDKVGNCCLTLYNQQMKVLDTSNCKFKNNTRININIKQKDNYIIVTSYLRSGNNNIDGQSYPYPSFDKENAKSNPNSILANLDPNVRIKYTTTPLCDTFIFNIKHTITKMEFPGYAILERLYFNKMNIYINDVTILENPLTKQSIIFSHTLDKYHEVKGFCRYFHKNDDNFIFGIANLEYMLFPCGAIDYFVYIPMNLKEDMKLKFEVKLVNNHIEFTASNIYSSYKCVINMLPQNLIFIKDFGKLKDFITDAINNTNDMVTFSYIESGSGINVKINYDCKYIQESVEYILLALPVDEIEVLRKRLERLESKN